MEPVETFRTGMKWAPWSESSSDFAVSPDGTRIIFGTGLITDGLLLLDLKSGQKTRLPGEVNRSWGMDNWSHDGHIRRTEEIYSSERMRDEVVFRRIEDAPTTAQGQ
ncbi:MAG: hypothetical protein LBE06_11600 [Azoarcus sp.]|nr:hypothetical protein [Azoarcus sp.]